MEEKIDRIDKNVKKLLDLTIVIVIVFTIVGIVISLKKK